MDLFELAMLHNNFENKCILVLVHIRKLFYPHGDNSMVFPPNIKWLSYVWQELHTVNIYRYKAIGANAFPGS